MSKHLLAGKVYGIIITTKESLTVGELVAYTRESEEDVLEVVEQLVKDNKLKWNEPDDGSKDSKT